MAYKDLTEHLIPDLQLPYKGNTYTITPPARDAGRKLAAINAIGVAAYAATLSECPTCGRHGTPEVPESTRALLESMKDDDIASLALGKDVHAQMLADDVPGPHIDRFGMYALYYWTVGEQTADAIFAAQKGPDASGEALASGRTSTPKPGHRMASARPTSGASFRRTAVPPKR